MNDKDSSNPVGRVLKKLIKEGKKKAKDTERLIKNLYRFKDLLKDLLTDEEILKDTVKDIDDYIVNNPDIKDPNIKEMAKDLKDYFEERLKNIKKNDP